MPGYLIRMIGILLIMATVMLTTCKPSKQAPDKVILQLNWFHEAEFTGYYVAKEKGFYADENITVDIREGGLKINPTEVFLKKGADIAIMSSVQQQNAMDSDLNPVAVAAVFQILPQIVFALSKSGIQKPQDMVGKRVAIKNETWRIAINKMLNQAGVDPAGIIEVNVEQDEIEMLYKGEVDVWTGYVHDEPTEAKIAGYEINMFFPAEYGSGAVDGLMVVSQNFLKKKPELVRRFVRASLRGWHYAITHPDESAKIIYIWQPKKSVQFHKIAVQSLVPIIDTGQVPIGWIDEKRWEKDVGARYDPRQPGYTMQFVKTVTEK